jgi:crotonobetainyl-CoA:carnitine CoA-transferase CaiB-like acyl-CoA transferase
MQQSAGGLRGLKVVDLGLGMAAALVAKFLREGGASITRVEPAAGDPFYDVYPAYEVWRRGSQLDAAAGGSAERLHALLADADVCILGGEDFPGVERRGDTAALQARHPRLVVLDIEGYPSSTRHAGRPAADVLVQARSGLASEHYTKRPLLMGFEPSSYGAALNGLAGLFAALLDRESSGRGQVVATSLFEGALTWPALLWVEAERPTPASKFVMPKDPWPLIFQCADGVWVQIVLGSTGSKGRLYRILEINDPSVDINDSGMPKPTGDPKNFFGDIDVLAQHTRKFQSSKLLEAIWAAGLPAEPVLAPGACWDDPQVVHNQIVVRETDGVRHVGHPIYAATSPAPPRAHRRTGPGPLSGMRVIDFGAFVAGPFSGVVLADLGADVVKVEATTGDPNRSIFRAYTAANRGKRAISIDLKTPEGVKIAQQLCAGADVVMNNFRPGVSARLGIDAKTLHALKPDLIVLESVAYGNGGPRAEGAGFDMCFQALCGHDFRAGGVGNPPLWNRTSMVDFAAALIGAVGVLQRLYERARTGAGAEVGAGLMNTGLYLLSELIQRPDTKFEGAPVLNHEQTGYHPAEQLYQAADGWLAIAARDEAMARRLVEVLKIGTKVSSARKAWGPEVAAVIAAAVSTRGQAELLAALAQADVWSEACSPSGESQNLRDPDLRRLGATVSTQHPQFGVVAQIGRLVRMTASSAAPAARHAPLPGEHTDELLTELGMPPEAIRDLRERKIVK